MRSSASTRGSRRLTAQRRRRSRRSRPSTSATPDALDALLRRHRRRLPSGGDGRGGSHRGRPAAVRLAQRPRHCRPAGRDGGARVDRLVLASSMVVYGDGGYSCPEHGEQPADAPRDWMHSSAGRFEVGCPVCGRPMDWRLVDEDAPLIAAQQLRREQAGAGALCVGLGRQLPGAAVALRYHNVYGPGMPARHAVLRGRGDLPIGDRAAASRRACSRTAARCATSCTSAMLRRQRAGGRAVASPPPDTFAAYNVCSGQPVAIADVAALVAAAPAATSRRVTGEFRAGDVRHIVASPSRPTPSSASPPRSRRPTACRRSRPQPLAAGPDRHQPVKSRCWTTRAKPTCTASAGRCQRGGSSAHEHQQPRDERQPDALDLGLAHPGQVSATTTATRRAAAAPSRPESRARGWSRRGPIPARPSTRRRRRGRAGAEAQRRQVAPDPVAAGRRLATPSQYRSWSTG